MIETGQQLFLWGATAWLHGLCLFALVWIVQALGLLRSPALAQTAWRAVVVAPVLSAALQVFVLHGAPVRLTLPAMPAPASAPVEIAVTDATLAAPSSPAAATAAASTRARLSPAAPLLSQLLLTRAAPALGWAWLALAALLALRVGVQQLRLALYRRKLAPVAEGPAVEAARSLGRRAGLGPLALLEDPALGGPIAIAPDAVVLPTWTHDALSSDQRSALLAHEIWHLKRRDPQVRTLLGTVCALALAPHGLVVMRRLDQLAEEACDAWAAHQSGGGRPLAECLAACLERGLGGPIPSGVAAMARRPSPVVQRVRRLLEEPTMKPQSRPLSHHALAAVLLGAVALAAPGLAFSGAPRAQSGVAHGVDPVIAARAEAEAAGAAARSAAAQAAEATAVAAVAQADAAAGAAAAADAASLAVIARVRAEAAAGEAVIAARWAEPADAAEGADLPEPAERADDRWAPVPPVPPTPPVAPAPRARPRAYPVAYPHAAPPPPPPPPPLPPMAHAAPPAPPAPPPPPPRLAPLPPPAPPAPVAPLAPLPPEDNG